MLKTALASVKALGIFFLTNQGGGLDSAAHLEYKMKHATILAFLLIITSELSAQPAIDIFRLYDSGGILVDLFYDVYQCADEDYLVCGVSGGRESWLIRLDPEGNPRWEIHQDNGLFRSVIEADNGDAVVVGRINLNFVVVRVDDEGQIVWNRTYSNEVGQGHSVIEMKNNDFMIAGNADSCGFVARINGDGEVNWQQSYGDIEEEKNVFSMRETDGGVVTAGRSTQERDNIRDVIGWI